MSENGQNEPEKEQLEQQRTYYVIRSQKIIKTKNSKTEQL